ncbi:hypothetical protein [Streptomyces sp. SID13726]|uniref:WD40 repeat domain-containing protein n=1 Tax=Streptomyces sp. SID13726 TaxID=2706058 RepID=UPI0013BB2FDC|nr:hypothetical protein [Streptomyces sp. SID13726]NEA99004.1 hypothetical protein [Streptomyces sp. SID13726]
MSGDLVEGVRGGASALTDPAFLVTAEPERVAALLGLAAGPAEKLAAAVYRASAHAHHGAGPAARRQILAVDAARYGDRDLSERLSSVGIPGAPAAHWRVEWATGSQVHPGFLGFLDSGPPAPMVAVDGRPATITRGDGVLSFRDPATGAEVARAPLTGWERGERTTAVVDGRPVEVSCAEPDGLPRILDLATGEVLGTLLTAAEVGPMLHEIRSATIDGRPHVVAGDERGVAVWDLTSREPVAEIVPDGDDLLSWAAVTLGGRPHLVTGSFYGKVELWDAVTGERTGGGQDDDGELRLMVAATVGGRPYAMTGGRNPYVGTPLDTVSVWSLDPLQRLDRFPVGAEQAATAALGDRCLVVVGDSQVWELTPAETVGDRAPGHTATVRAVATAVVDGRPVAVTGGDDETLRLWDLATGRPVGCPLSGKTDDYDGVTWVRTTEVDGRPYAVSGHDSGYDEYTRVWDLAAGAEVVDDDRVEEVAASLTDDTLPVPADAVTDGLMICRPWVRVPPVLPLQASDL